MKEFVVNRENAEIEIQRFFDDMDIDSDVSKLDEDDRKGFLENKEILIGAVMDGRLVINENSEPVYTPKRGTPNPLTFREPTGATYMAMDQKKTGQDVGKMMALMDAMTKSAPGTTAKLANVDFKVARSIAVLFLA
ncbi:MAG: hypothetical protein RR182_01025 [Alistipes sp.]